MGLQFKTTLPSLTFIVNESSCCHQRPFSFFCGHAMERYKRVETLWSDLSTSGLRRLLPYHHEVYCTCASTIIGVLTSLSALKNTYLWTPTIKILTVGLDEVWDKGIGIHDALKWLLHAIARLWSDSKRYGWGVGRRDRGSRYILQGQSSTLSFQNEPEVRLQGCWVS